MRPRHRPGLLALLACCALAPLLTANAAPAAGSARHGARTAATTATTLPFAGPSGYAQTANEQPGPNLQPGSEPSVLPADLLIADRNNNALVIVSPTGNVVWQFPRPGDLAPGQVFRTPDDAFFTPNGKDIIVTEEDEYAVAEVSIATHRIVWQYGHPGTPGATPGYLDNPDDAMMLPNGEIVLADIRNCRLLVLRPPSASPVEQLGTTGACAHQPPAYWGSPNGAFPLSNGNWLVTEINGDWVDELDLATGQVLWSTNPPGVLYPSDTNQVSGSTFITADYSNPGQVVEFDSSGNLVWRYAPTGTQSLDQPSLALPLPNGDVILNDDWNHRVIVVDPKTNQVVWQYGHTGVPGSGPGYLYKPDGLDLAPPYALTVTHRSTMTGPAGSTGHA